MNQLSSSLLPPTLRATEFSRLDREGHIYLDYTGSALYPQSLIEAHTDLLQKHTFGNPHSINPTSNFSTQLVEKARSQILTYFNADPQIYTLIFTANASGALKTVAESYPFSSKSTFAYLADNHNSVIGIREYAKRAKSTVKTLPLTSTLRADNMLQHLRQQKLRTNARSLLAFPAQSNFSGVKHDLSIVKKAQELGWDVLLDAAAFVPTSKLDLNDVPADFVSVSFYKMFGYPTGIGGLIIRKDMLNKLQKPWFAGGTIEIASVVADKHVLTNGPERFEDGTLNFLSIAALPLGLKFLKNIGMDNIQKHVFELTKKLLEELIEMKHSNGYPVVKLYGPKDMKNRGGTIAFGVFDRYGKEIDVRLIEKVASEKGISLRVGCFCNPGAGEVALKMNKREGDLKRIFKILERKRKANLEELSKCMGKVYLGSVRISVGIASTEDDVNGFLDFLEEFADEHVVELDTSEKIMNEEDLLETKATVGCIRCPF